MSKIVMTITVNIQLKLASDFLLLYFFLFSLLPLCSILLLSICYLVRFPYPVGSSGEPDNMFVSSPSSSGLKAFAKWEVDKKVDARVDGQTEMAHPHHYAATQDNIMTIYMTILSPPPLCCNNITSQYIVSPSQQGWVKWKCKCIDVWPTKF